MPHQDQIQQAAPARYLQVIIELLSDAGKGQPGLTPLRMTGGIPMLPWEAVAVLNGQLGSSASNNCHDEQRQPPPPVTMSSFGSATSQEKGGCRQCPPTLTWGR